MRNNLLIVGKAFIAMWVLGQVFQSSYSQNSIFSIGTSIAVAIYLGLHSDLITLIKFKISKS